MRTRKPRPTLALRASFVSQENCLAVLGIDARRYLDRLVPLCRGYVVQLGKLRLTPIEVAEEALRALAGNDDPIESTPEPADDAQPQTVDAVLAMLGKERVA